MSDCDFPDVDSSSTVLVIGNPPWVTNSGQGLARAKNLPTKFNRFGLAGLAAMTGKANFDIAEAIILAAVSALSRAGELRLALLVKRSVALKVAENFMRATGSVDLSFSKIDAKRWFAASVDAGLFQMTIRRGLASTQVIRLFEAVGAGGPPILAGMAANRFIQRLDLYDHAQHIEASSESDVMAWRQGIKHDAAKVLELRQTPDGLFNGMGEKVDVEPDVLCPLYKSSDLANGRSASRVFPLYQFDLSGPVEEIGGRWPRLAAYLERNRGQLDARGSKIYSGKPPYTLFGVGPYTTAPFKVAVSGLYKTPRFAVLMPSPEGAPPLVDDTCNMLAFDNLTHAQQVADYLNGPLVSAFLSAVADSAAKRPYTVDVLRRIRNPRADESAESALAFEMGVPYAATP